MGSMQGIWIGLDETLRRLRRSYRKAGRRYRPALDVLEDRLTPSAVASEWIPPAPDLSEVAALHGDPGSTAAFVDTGTSVPETSSTFPDVTNPTAGLTPLIVEVPAVLPPADLDVVPELPDLQEQTSPVAGSAVPDRTAPIEAALTRLSELEKSAVSLKENFLSAPDVESEEFEGMAPADESYADSEGDLGPRGDRASSTITSTELILPEADLPRPEDEATGTAPAQSRLLLVAALAPGLNGAWNAGAPGALATPPGELPAAAGTATAGTSDVQGLPVALPASADPAPLPESDTADAGAAWYDHVGVRLLLALGALFPGLGIMAELGRNSRSESAAKVRTARKAPAPPVA